MSGISLYLLGSYQITLGGKAPTRPIAAKGAALLAYLAVEAGPARREKLAGMLWPESSEAHARQSLSQALYALRESLEPKPGEQQLFNLTAHGIQINAQANVWVDVVEFTHLLQAVEKHSHSLWLTCPTCFEHLQRAAALYRGSFLSDFSLKDNVAFSEWVVVTRENLHRRAIRALHMLGECLEAQGQTEQALEHAWRQVELDPLGEAGHRQAMRLLAANGKRNEALVQYGTLQGILQDTLGVAPDGETRQLYEHILARETLPVLASMREVRIPGMLIPLIGRQAELGRLKAILRDPSCRLVTIFGQGGVGKTRLALEVARQMSPSFPDGVYYISLAANQAGSPVWPLLAEALNFPIRENEDPGHQLLKYLGDKRALLLFDSFEVAMEQANWLADLLVHTPRLTALVTSRACLEISSEQVFALGGMEVPVPGEYETAEQYEAVQLFLTFARHRQPAFKLDERNCPGVVRICQLVQGLPLGLLLASSWIGLYSPDEIAKQIESSLDFLEVSWSDIPNRQRSLRATFDYSWNLLTGEEQDLFAALSIFKGGFTLAAVEPVTGAHTRLLRSLVDKSLINRSVDGRYQIHDLVRQLAEERLMEHPERSRELCARHSRYYLGELGGWVKDLMTNQQRVSLETIDREAENLRIAWRQAVATKEWEGIAQGLEGMSLFADLRFRFEEGERACRIALENNPPGSVSELSSYLLIWQAHFLRRLGKTEQAGKLLQGEMEHLIALELAGEDTRNLRAQLLYELGELNMYSNRENARNYYQQSLALYDEIGDPRGQALVLTSLGEAIHHTGPLDVAQVLLDRGVDLCRKQGDPRLLSRCILWNGWNQLRQGNMAVAEKLIRESIEINRTAGDRYAEAFWSAELGTVKAWMGHLQEGVELITTSIPIFKELGLKQEETLNRLRRGLFYTNVMDFDRARIDFQDCLSSSYELNYQRGIGLAIFGTGGVSLNDGNYKQAEERYLQALPILNGVQADEAGWCLALLVYTMRLMGNPARGWMYARQGLELARNAHVYHSAAMTILGIAALLVDEGEIERAIELHALVMKYPLFKSSAWFHDIAGQPVEAASDNLSPEVVEAAQKRGTERELFATVQELLGELKSRLESQNVDETVHVD